MTFRFIDDHRERWSVERMARVLEVSTSGYYAWKHRKPSRKAVSDCALVEIIKDIQKRHKRRYGGPRVHAELIALGHKAGRHRVARLMRLHGLSCLPSFWFSSGGSGRRTGTSGSSFQCCQRSGKCR